MGLERGGQDDHHDQRQRFTIYMTDPTTCASSHETSSTPSTMQYGLPCVELRSRGLGTPLQANEASDHIGLPSDNLSSAVSERCFQKYPSRLPLLCAMSQLARLRFGGHVTFHHDREGPGRCPSGPHSAAPISTTVDQRRFSSFAVHVHGCRSGSTTRPRPAKRPSARSEQFLSLPAQHPRAGRRTQIDTGDRPDHPSRAVEHHPRQPHRYDARRARPPRHRQQQVLRVRRHFAQRDRHQLRPARRCRRFRSSAATRG